MVGSLALGRFRIEEELGKGAFGTVYRGWDTRLRRDVAVKVISLPAAGRDRAVREAHAAARLAHSKIVALYEFGLEEESAYLVTELVTGSSFREELEEGDLSDREIASIGIDLVEALEHAHERGVVHRDLKPANVLVSERDGIAKLVDFGVASLSDEAGLTATGDILGTLAYMSPEQAEGGPVGPESDVYSLCLLLYEAFTGSNPNRRGTAAATVRAIGSVPDSLAELRPDLPELLTDLIDQGLEPLPEHRPTVESIRRASESVQSELSDLPPAEGGSAPSAGAVGLSSLKLSEFAGVLARHARAAVLAITLVLAGGFALAGSPGASLVAGVIALPFVVLARSGGPLLYLPILAPFAGYAGIAALFPALCGLAGSWRDRLLLAVSGLLFVGVLQANGVAMGIDTVPAAPADWQRSLAGGGELLASFATATEFLTTAAIWAAATLIAGVLLFPVRMWNGRRRGFRRIDGESATAEATSRSRLERQQ